MTFVPAVVGVTPMLKVHVALAGIGASEYTNADEPPVTPEMPGTQPPVEENATGVDTTRPAGSESLITTPVSARGFWFVTDNVNVDFCVTTIVVGLNVFVRTGGARS